MGCIAAIVSGKNYKYDGSIIIIVGAIAAIMNGIVSRRIETLAEES